MSFKLFFHYISYLQYPLILVGLYFVIKPYFGGFEYLKENPDLIFKNLNSCLLFMGLGISFSSLQDTTKTQNKFSENIWKNPKKGKKMIILITVQILFFLSIGLIGYFSQIEILNKISVGMIILGLGMFGFLKSAIEVFENHRTDNKDV
ncbi:hypothetical protein [Zunongwangia profunda]|jgi:magnesium-transporting ATPase (P-type)|uniref:hypothetical protein n=1 Tax=Zunongwangia profunda TaxID=398743 RepID=UPI000C8A6DB0|nr:hypothetical protein [Zunongwangia profunda]MAG87359.1 hypothetical protein [Flavobacteriaceae bacterium]MCC4229483.1 hypothetical protein [Zunongwangia profunda]|tara:strand:+ start:57 stop:503 length:447 start_codon:yes stop_codon:yes gene_type:complete